MPPSPTCADSRGRAADCLLRAATPRPDGGLGTHGRIPEPLHCSHVHFAAAFFSQLTTEWIMKTDKEGGQAARLTSRALQQGHFKI